MCNDLLVRQNKIIEILTRNKDALNSDEGIKAIAEEITNKFITPLYNELVREIALNDKIRDDYNCLFVGIEQIITVTGNTLNDLQNQIHESTNI